MNLLATQPFQSTFGALKTRKKPRMASDSYAEMALAAGQATDT